MANFELLRKNLEARGYETSFFSSREEAAAYLEKQIQGTVVGFGGSVTLQEMGLYERLSVHNTVYWHWKGDERRKCNEAPVYICSVNGVAETGELINIDGSGNRVAATQFGPQKVYLVVGSNKIAPTFEEALWRARNIAAPKNAQRLGCKTPCAARGDKCYDCSVPGRICRSLSVFWARPLGVGSIEVVLIDEPLGF